MNNYHAYPAHAAFGGYKQSGIGRETHKMMLDHYQQTKNMWSATTPTSLGSSEPIQRSRSAPARTGRTSPQRQAKAAKLSPGLFVSGQGPDPGRDRAAGDAPPPTARATKSVLTSGRPADGGACGRAPGTLKVS